MSNADVFWRVFYGLLALGACYFAIANPIMTSIKADVTAAIVGCVTEACLGEGK